MGISRWPMESRYSVDISRPPSRPPTPQRSAQASVYFESVNSAVFEVFSRILSVIIWEVRNES